jgi:2,4-dienoyl-CoA reductase-like NADH-dependent reductase (Old Yellow Enzyme family)
MKALGGRLRRRRSLSTTTGRRHKSSTTPGSPVFATPLSLRRDAPTDWASIANQRDDRYGGSLANRMRFPLEVAAAVRAVWPRDKALGMRITGSDWIPGALTPEDAAVYAGELKAIGLDYVCVSSGGISPKARIAVAPGYQVPFAEIVRKTSGIAVQAVGMIADPHQAEAIVAEGRADCVALARGFLDDPRWAWHAADALGAKIACPPQYERSRPNLWPGAALARPERAR